MTTKLDIVGLDPHTTRLLLRSTPHCPMDLPVTFGVGPCPGDCSAAGGALVVTVITWRMADHPVLLQVSMQGPVQAFDVETGTLLHQPGDVHITVTGQERFFPLDALEALHAWEMCDEGFSVTSTTAPTEAHIADVVVVRALITGDLPYGWQLRSMSGCLSNFCVEPGLVQPLEPGQHLAGMPVNVYSESLNTGLALLGTHVSAAARGCLFVTTTPCAAGTVVTLTIVAMPPASQATTTSTTIVFDNHIPAGVVFYLQDAPSRTLLVGDADTHEWRLVQQCDGESTWDWSHAPRDGVVIIQATLNHALAAELIMKPSECSVALPATRRRLGGSRHCVAMPPGAYFHGSVCVDHEDDIASEVSCRHAQWHADEAPVSRLPPAVPLVCIKDNDEHR